MMAYADEGSEQIKTCVDESVGHWIKKVEKFRKKIGKVKSIVDTNR